MMLSLRFPDALWRFAMVKRRFCLCKISDLRRLFVWTGKRQNHRPKSPKHKNIRRIKRKRARDHALKYPANEN